MDQSDKENTGKNEKKAGIIGRLGEAHCCQCGVGFETDLTEPWGWSDGEWLYLCPVCACMVEELMGRFGYE